MSIVRRLARPLLAAAFIETGMSSLRHPNARAERIRPLVDQVSGQLGQSVDPELVLRVDGALLIGAGGMLALGRMPRLAALALAAGAAPGTYAEIAFWQEKDPQRRRERRNEVLTRLGLIGGALLAAVDTSGRPGLLWRGRHAVGHVQHAAGDTLRTAELTGRGIRRRAGRATRQATGAGAQARISGRQARRQAALAGRAAQARAAAARRDARRALERTRRQAATPHPTALHRS